MTISTRRLSRLPSIMTPCWPCGSLKTPTTETSCGPPGGGAAISAGIARARQDHAQPEHQNECG